MPPPVNRDLYDIAAKNVQNGTWTVDATAGRVISGRLHRPIGAKHPNLGYVLLTVVRGPFGTPGRTATVMAHRVIWEAVHGPIPEGLEINHMNARKDDNRIENLELVTRQGNCQHASRLGLLWMQRKAA